MGDRGDPRRVLFVFFLFFSFFRDFGPEGLRLGLCPEFGPMGKGSCVFHSWPWARSSRSGSAGPQTSRVTVVWGALQSISFKLLHICYFYLKSSRVSEWEVVIRESGKERRKNVFFLERLDLD